MKIIKIIAFLWQLPQNVLGLFLILLYKAKKNEYTCYPSSGKDKSDELTTITIWNIPKAGFGVSLGKYILLDLTVYNATDVKHEHGHQKQSLILGWFYLLLVGLPSAIRNIYSRIMKKDNAWYYGGYPENWADNLGKVDRNFSKKG